MLGGFTFDEDPKPGTEVAMADLFDQYLGRLGVPVLAGVPAGHQRGRLGNVETSYEMFGLKEDDLRARFAPYVERFLT